MTPARRPRRQRGPGRGGRAAAALALALALALAPLAPGGAAAAGPSPAPSPGSSPGSAAQEPRSPVVVTVSTLAPRAPQPGGRLQVAGTLRNTGRSPVSDLRVALRVGGRIRFRSELAAADRDGAETRRVPSTVVGDPAPLAPGASRRFDLRTPLAALELGGDGAYPVQVEVRGVVDGGSRGDVVGLVSTYLPWFASPPTGTTRIAWLWPLVAPPSRAPRLTARGPLLLDEQLAADVRRGGRLERALRAARFAEQGQCDQRPRPPADDSAAAGPPVHPPTAPCRGEAVPVTYALDADTLDALQGMAGGYQVLASASRRVPGTGAAPAQGWLASLRAAATPAAGVVALPFADADVVSLTGPTSDLAGDVGPAVQLGRTGTATVVGRTPLRGVQLAPPGAVGGDALEAYLGAGTSALVVTEDALPPRPARQAQTSGARNPLTTAAGTLTGLVADAGLSALLAPDHTRWSGPRLAEQRFLVETALVTAEEPGATRTLVVAPPRDADLVPSVAAQSLLDSGRLPWLCAVPLADVAAGHEHCAAGGPTGSADAARGAPVAPAVDAPGLSREQLDAVGAARRQIDQLTGAVLAPSDAAAETRARLLRGALRAESSAWRQRTAQTRGRTLARLLRDDVGELLHKVRILSGPVTLTSSSSQLTVDVENHLDQAVTVRVALSAGSAARLAVEGAGVTEVPPRTSVPVYLRAEPRTSGQFPVQARLLDRRSEPFGATSQFLIRSTRYGVVALAVTGIAAGVLLVAAGARLVRRGLQRRRTA